MPTASNFRSGLLGAILFAIAIVGLLPNSLRSRADDEKPIVEQIRPGMSAEEVKKVIGPPRRISRQVVYRRYLEMWTYEQPVNLLVEFSCIKGQDPRVTVVHPLRP